LADLAAAAGLGPNARVTTEAEVLSGRFAPARRRHRGYSSWLVLRKPEVTR
jgi:hypothetical protein